MAPTFIPVMHHELNNTLTRITSAAVAMSPVGQYKDLVQHHQVPFPWPTHSSLPPYESVLWMKRKHSCVARRSTHKTTTKR